MNDPRTRGEKEASKASLSLACACGLETGAQMKLESAWRKLTSCLSEGTTRQVRANAGEIAPVEQVGDFAFRLDLHPFSKEEGSREGLLKGEVYVVVSGLIVGISAEAAFRAKIWNREGRGGEQTIEVVLLLFAAQMISKGGHVGYVVVVVLAVLIPAGVADELARGVIDGVERRAGEDGEGQAALQNPYAAHLPAPESIPGEHRVVDRKSAVDGER